MMEEKAEKYKKNTKAVRKIDLSIEGRLQPQALEVEEAVLGALMIEKNAPERVLDVLNSDAFYKDAHKYIYESIVELFKDGHPVDIITVTDKLRSKGQLEFVGGAYFVSRLTQRVASTANLEYHSHIVMQKYVQRELIAVSGEIVHDAFEAGVDAFELLDRSEEKIFRVKDKSIKKNVEDIGQLINKAIRQIQNTKSGESGITGVPSGIVEIDRITAGWQRSDLIILAGRPGMGKTAFVLSIARNAAVDHDTPVALFSLEMSSVQLVTRLISAETQLSSEKLRTGKLTEAEWTQLNTKIQQISEAKIFIDDTPALSVFELKAKARRLKANHHIGMIVIDYLQLMRGEDSKNGNREQEISYISRSLKGLAKDLDIPIIALAQLSRQVEQRQDKKPILSDLRESGSIEQDADIVGFIYRPEYYKIQEVDGMDTTGLAQFIIEKHRNGSTGGVWMRFRNEYAKFENAEVGMGMGEDLDYNPNINVMTMQSKMNDLDPFDDEEGTPF